jgi:pyruvate/2-oxoglutarate dehydrogenase complex dihydrolipoamide dehydrogenase (E3) component
MNENYDAIVIGTGQAGPSLAVRMAGSGQRVAIIERDRFGGTCVNAGCIPTKTLVASAYAAHMARRASEFGVQLGGTVTVDMQRVKARKDEITGKSSTGVEAWLPGTQNCTVDGELPLDRFAQTRRPTPFRGDLLSLSSEACAFG